MIYSGIVKYEEADIAFLFDEHKLTLFPSIELFNSLTMRFDKESICYINEKKPFTDGYLEGKVNGQFLYIHFFFDPKQYGTSQKNFIECESPYPVSFCQ